MVGIDIVEINRVKLFESFIKYVLTPDEQEELLTRHTDTAKKEYLAGRFAVKEAIFKATQDQSYLNYACLNAKNGKPYIKDHPEIDVSISHDGDIAIGIVQIQ
jgi:holo-[acyl-carrier protein] synthase